MILSIFVGAIGVILMLCIPIDWDKHGFLPLLWIVACISLPFCIFYSILKQIDLSSSIVCCAMGTNAPMIVRANTCFKKRKFFAFFLNAMAAISVIGSAVFAILMREASYVIGYLLFAGGVFSLLADLKSEQA